MENFNVIPFFNVKAASLSLCFSQIFKKDTNPCLTVLFVSLPVFLDDFFLLNCVWTVSLNCGTKLIKQVYEDF